MMTRIAKFLDLMDPFLCFARIILNTPIDYQERTARFQDARAFTDELLGCAKVMRGHSTRYQIKTFVGVRKFLCRMLRT